MFIYKQLTSRMYVCSMIKSEIQQRKSKPGTLAKIARLIVLIFFNSSDLFAPELSPRLSGKSSMASNQLQVRILSWNIAMLPIFDMVHSGKNRAKGIGKALQPLDYDIIVFQEAFSPMARRAIYRKLRRYYPFNYGPANAGISLRINSGVWILSRIPLSVVREYKFSGCQGFDCLSRKGAILLEGQWNDQAFQLIGTHLDSNENDPAVRIAQLNELYDSIISPYSRPGIPQIICGDFNTDRELSGQYLNMLKILKCDDGDLSGDERITFGFPVNKEVQESNEKPRQLDYIFTKNSEVLELIERKVIAIKELWANVKYNLSDHYGIEATIKFKPAEPLTGSLQ